MPRAPRKQKSRWNAPSPIMQAFHELMAKRPEPMPAPKRAAVSVVELFEKFLDWCAQHRASLTYEGHRWHLQRFIDHLAYAARMPAEELKPHHVFSWVDTHPDWGRTYRRNAITSVQRAFLWVEKVGHILHCPVGYVEKPMPDRREQVSARPADARAGHSPLF